MDKLTQAFALLSHWRHLPAYQLERRADIFFALYMQEVIQAKTGMILSPTIIPELPINKSVIDHGTTGHQSVKVDYALFSRDQSQVFFVELKTDQGSRRSDQDDYLERAQSVGFAKIVRGIVEIAQHTKAYQKYYHLVSLLAQLGFVSLPDDIEDFSPYECPFYEHCTAGLPVIEYPIEELPSLRGSRKSALVEQGIESIKEICQEADLLPLQARVRDAVQSNKPFVSSKLAAAVAKPAYPIHHLDFETVMFTYLTCQINSSA